MAILIVAIFVCIALFLLDYLWKIKIPVPSPSLRIPVIGHALFLGKAPHKTLTSWAKELGSVYGIQVLNKTVLVLNSYKAANEVFREKQEEFAARPPSFRNNYLQGSGGSGEAKSIFFQDTNEKWKKMKNYTFSHIADFVKTEEHTSIAVQVCSDFAQMIQTRAKEEIIDPYDSVHTAMSCYFYSLIWGQKQNVDDQFFQKLAYIEPLIRAHSSTKGRELDMFPWLRFFGNETFKVLTNGIEISTELFQNLKEKFSTEKNSTGIGAAFMDGRDGLEISDEIRSIIIGTDCYYPAIGPSFAVVCGYLMMMASNQEIQGKIFAEVSSRLKQKKMKYIVPSDRHHMSYTQASVLEVLRYYSTVPVTIRKVLVDTSIQGVAIPKDSTIMINIWRIHHDEMFWKDPWEFNPDRFLDSSGNLLNADDPNMQRLVHQGAGLRTCLGKKAIDEIIFMFMASTVHKFHIRPVGGIDVPFDPRQWDELIFSLEPKTCQLRFTSRE